MATPRDHVHDIDARVPAPPTSTFIPPEAMARGREIEQPVGMLRPTSKEEIVEWRGKPAFPAGNIPYLNKLAKNRGQDGEPKGGGGMIC